MPRGAVGVRADEIRSENAAQNGGAERQLAEDFVGREGKVEKEDNADGLLRFRLLLHLHRLLALFLTSLLRSHALEVHQRVLRAQRVQLLPFTPFFFVSYQHFLIIQIVVQIIHEFWTRRIQPFLLLDRRFPRHTPAPRGLRSTLVPRGIQRRRGRRQIPGNVHVYAGIRARNRRPRSTLDPRGNAYRRFRVAR